MKSATLTEFCSKMERHLDSLERDQDFLILSGPKKKYFVLMPRDKFNSIMETVHLLSTTANAKLLMESIRQDKSGKVLKK